VTVFNTVGDVVNVPWCIFRARCVR